MASVENRVVRMAFENASFEKKVATTLGTIGALNTSLSNLGTKNGLADIKAADGKFSLPGMQGAVEGVSAKFAAMATIGITALANITNKAIDAGLQLGKSLTLEPIMDGFAEYELNMNSIQTILANTRKQGTSLQDVNGALDELNEYSDQTIYNFAQMTKNIGSATAAGVDLDTAVTYVKGFANSAAVAGVDATSMAGGLEQMSQALAAGTIKAQDWISLEKRGLAGQVQQEAFFNMAKAMGTLADVPMEQSFSEWTDAGNTLRGSLADGWLTAEVFTNTMGVFAGEMSDAELAALGFNDAMIAEARELGEVAIDAATKIRTGTQLLDVLKESVASGWSVSFRTVFGDFEEATELFSNLGNALTGMVDESSSARNKMLQDWKDLGGRTELIDGLRASFAALGNIFGAVKRGFRSVFPKKTGEDLYNMTKRFADVARAIEKFTNSGAKMAVITGIFKGIFSVFKLGFTVIGAVAKGLVAIVKAIIPMGSGNVLGPLQQLMEFVANIDAAKVGYRVLEFFEAIASKIATAMPYIREAFNILFKGDYGGGVFSEDSAVVDFLFKVREFALAIPPAFKEVGRAIGDFVGKLDFSGIGDFFGSIGSAASGVSFDTSIFDNVVERAKRLGKAFGTIGDIWSKFIAGLGNIGGAIADAGGALKDFFGQLGGGVETAVSDTKDANYDGLFDALAAVFLGGLAAGFVRFLNKGFDFNFDFGGGIFERLGDTLKGVNGVLKGMQADLKSGALLKIAAAIGVLAIAIIALSFVDPQKLAAATAAIAVGFGLLAGALTILQRIEFSSTDAAKMGLMALAFGLLSGALILLAVAMKIYATMGWEEIAKGTSVLMASIGGIILMSKYLKDEARGMIKASIAMFFLSLSMGSMYKVIKKFGEMEWQVLVQGMGALALAIGGLTVAMNRLPTDLEKRTAGTLGFSIAIGILVLAMEHMGRLPIPVIVQGGIAFATMLVLLVQALKRMPKNMNVMASQMMGLAGAILVMSIAIGMLGRMDPLELGQGVLAMAVALGVLVAALKLAQGGTAGAFSLLIIAGAMVILAAAVAAFAALGILEFAIGLGLMAVAIGVLAGVAFLIQPALPALLLLGLALAAIGIGIGAIGFGAAQVAKAILIMAQVGAQGSEAMVAALETLAGAFPTIFKALAEGIIEFVATLGESIPMFIELGVEILMSLLEGLREVLPEIFGFIGDLITELLDLIVEKHDEFTRAGIDLLKNFLAGIGENIGEVVTLVSNIITGFLDAMAEEVPNIVESLVGYFTAILTTLAETMGTLMFGLAPQIIAAFINGMVSGLTGGISALWEAFLNLFNSIKEWVLGAFGIASPSQWFTDIGGFLMSGLLNGIVAGALAVWGWFTGLASTVAGWVSDAIDWLFDAGSDVLTGMWEGMQDVAITVSDWVSDLPGNILDWLGSLIRTLWNKGKDLLTGLYNGILNGWNKAKNWLGGIGSKILSAVGSLFRTLWNKGKDLLSGLYNGIINQWSLVRDWVGGIPGRVVSAIGSGFTTLRHIGVNLINGLKNGIISVWNGFSSWIWDKAKSIPGKFLDAIPIIGGPARVTYELGQSLMMGFEYGIRKMEDAPVDAAERATGGITMALAKGVAEIERMANEMSTDISPTITPVMDLTSMKRSTKELARLLPSSSAAHAGVISATVPGRAEVTDHASKQTEIKFEQTINAPRQLSTGDIYRQTRSQIAMAKDELSIP